MSILVNKNTKVIARGMTGVAQVRAAGGLVDANAPTPYFTHILCNCGILP